MAIGSNKVQTCVNAEINDASTSWLLFLNHVAFMLIVQKLDNRHPAVSIVDIITKARRINDGQFHLEVLLLEF